MKKIMMMVAVALSASFAFSASCDWKIALSGGSSGRVWDKTGSKVWTATDSGNSNQVLYFMLSSQVADFTTALKGGTSLSGKYIDSTTSFTAASGISAQKTATSDLITTESQSFQLVLVYDDAAGNTWYKVSEALESGARAQVTDPSLLQFQSNAQINPAAGGWAAASAAPEPTSGLLLLLGMAGLALKRKKA